MKTKKFSFFCILKFHPNTHTVDAHDEQAKNKHLSIVKKVIVQWPKYNLQIFHFLGCNIRNK